MNTIVPQGGAEIPNNNFTKKQIDNLKTTSTH